MNLQDPNGSCLWAWVAFDARGQVVASEKGEQGNGFGVTANVAKFHAVIQALSWLAVNAPKTPAEVLCDLKLVVHSVNDGWNNTLPHIKQLCQTAKTFLARTKAELVWIPKEENKAAELFKEESKFARKSRAKAA
ncbi:MAG: reverse transcriptase-like protein [Acidobacteriota bacterium]|nr:reverse transcriptase-like protein [Acidobacteriota bacterium]